MKKILYIILFFLGQTLTAGAADDERGWMLSTTDTARYAGVALGNGGIGILPGKELFAVDKVILNHVFERGNGRQVSHVLEGLNPWALTCLVDNRPVTSGRISGWTQTLDMKRAVFRTSFRVDDTAEFVYETAALRNVAYAGIMTVTVRALKPVDVKFRATISGSSYYQPSDGTPHSVQTEKGTYHILRRTVVSAGGTQTVSASSAFIGEGWTQTGPADTGTATVSCVMKKGETKTVSLAGAVCSTRDFHDPANESEREVVYMAATGLSSLMRAHERLWEDLWTSDIVIEGDDESQRRVRLALFNLYSSVRAGSRLSVPPMGLSSAKGYNGHVFWDAETWMFPPLLVLRPELAESMVDYRTDRLRPALKRAAAYGYRGAMFPWESDDWGEESTPTFALTGPFEHHITADIAIACRNYFCVSKDTTWLRTTGWPLIKAAADFIESRVTPNPDGSYSFRNVTGADEYANGVDDNAFTNATAKLALTYACELSAVCGAHPGKEWPVIAGKLRLLTFPDGVLREHATYKGELIKQADANLLAYPLGLRTDADLIRKDLAYYEPKIDKVNGPAMSYAIFAVQYARLGEAENAWRMFLRSFVPHERKPFGVLAETPSSDNPYFMTGAGGMLQAVLFGFGGLEITKDGLTTVPSVLPEHWKRLILKGIGPEKKTYVRTH